MVEVKAGKADVAFPDLCLRWILSQVQRWDAMWVEKPA